MPLPRCALAPYKRRGRMPAESYWLRVHATTSRGRATCEMHPPRQAVRHAWRVSRHASHSTISMRRTSSLNHHGQQQRHTLHAAAHCDPSA
eukprot:scaffold260996_cov33-Tisochrysis_lutea.AAC.5